MKIRTQLILAFLLLAILPLAGIVLFSYASSSAAVRESALEEAEALSAEMEARLERVRETLRRRVGSLPFRVLTQVEPGADEKEVVADLREQLGEMASFVDALAFEPSAPPLPPRPPTSGASTVPPGADAGSRPPGPSARPMAPGAHARPFEPEGSSSQPVRRPAERRRAATAPPAARAAPADPVPRPDTPPENHFEVHDVETHRFEVRTDGPIEIEAVDLDSGTDSETDERAWVIELVTPDNEGSATADATPVPRARVPRARIRSSRVPEEGTAGPPSAGTVDPDLAQLYYDAFREHMEPSYLTDLGYGTDGRALPPIVDLESLRTWAETHGSGAPPELGEPDRQAEPSTSRDDFARPRRWDTMAEARRREWQRRVEMVMGEDFDVVPIREGGQLVGVVRPRINPETVLEVVFGQMPREAGEIPFAVDNEGHLYTPDDQDRQRLLEAIGQQDAEGPVFASNELPPRKVMDRWVIATSRHRASGLAFGVARPFGDSLGRLQSISVRNFVFGLLMIALAVIGILPVSGHLAKRLGQVTEAAQRIAKGDLEARVPVAGGGELAQLARVFNSMAHDLRDQQERLVAEERRQRDRELERQLMHAELERRGQELEEARQFQLSMLPRKLPDHPHYLLSVSMHTATEVGGDYYDFRLAEGGPLTIALGDATGHGARAGTMVTVIKSLFTDCSFATTSPTAFLRDAQRTVRRMELGRMAMALQVLQLEGDCLRLTNAGMPPVLWHRKERKKIEEIEVRGMPLGGLQSEFLAHDVLLGSGDTLLLFSDGLAEQPGSDGGPVGYDFVRDCFAQALAEAMESESEEEGGVEAEGAVEAEGGVDPQRASLDRVLASLENAIDQLTGGDAPADDISLMLIRIR